MRAAGVPEDAPGVWIAGDPDTVAEKASELRDAGIEGLTISMPDVHDLEVLELAGQRSARVRALRTGHSHRASHYGTAPAQPGCAGAANPSAVCRSGDQRRAGHRRRLLEAEQLAAPSERRRRARRRRAA